MTSPARASRITGMPPGARTLTGLSAFAAGAAAALLALLAWHVEGGQAASAARLSVRVAESTNLAMPRRAVDHGAFLSPSGPAEGLRHRIRIRNATADPLRVQVRGRLTDRSLAHLVHVRIGDPSGPLFRGPTGGLERGSRSFVLPSHASTTLRLAAWIPAGSASGWHARSGVLDLELATRVATGP